MKYCPEECGYLRTTRRNRTGCDNIPFPADTPKFTAAKSGRPSLACAMICFRNIDFTFLLLRQTTHYRMLVCRNVYESHKRIARAGGGRFHFVKEPCCIAARDAYSPHSENLVKRSAINFLHPAQTEVCYALKEL